MIQPQMVRRLGTADAVNLGLGAMLGTGVFTVFGPAADAAGAWLFLALLIAAGVAAANALSSADLAATYPESGGAYVYGREELGRAWGVLAGAAFLTGKTASCAAAGLVFASYAVPDVRRPVAVAAVLAMTALNMVGVRWTARGTRLLVSVVLVVLVGVVVTVLAGRIGGGGPGLGGGTDRPNVLYAAALLFFAFAGYARIATLGEEVRDPARTIRRAIPLALGIVLVVYALVAAACLWALGGAGLAGSATPVSDAVDAVGASGLGPVVTVGAAVATLSALVSVLAGMSRTAYAMANRGDLPRRLSTLSPTGTPWVADVLLAVVVCGLVLVLDPASAVALSAGTVLLYYAVANASALRLAGDQRRWPRSVPAAGLAGCVILAVALLVTALAG